MIINRKESSLFGLWLRILFLEDSVASNILSIHVEHVTSFSSGADEASHIVLDTSCHDFRQYDPFSHELDMGRHFYSF